MPADPRDDEQLLGVVCNTRPRTSRAVGNPLLLHRRHPASLGMFDEARDMQPPGDNNQAEIFQPRVWVNLKGESHMGRGCAIAGSRRSHTPAERGHTSALRLTLGITGRCRGGLVASWGVTALSRCTPCPGERRPLSVTDIKGVCCISKRDEQKCGGASRSPRVQPRDRSPFTPSPAEGEKV